MVCLCAHLGHSLLSWSSGSNSLQVTLDMSCPSRPVLKSLLMKGKRKAAQHLNLWKIKKDVRQAIRCSYETQLQEKSTDKTQLARSTHVCESDLWTTVYCVWMTHQKHLTLTFVPLPLMPSPDIKHEQALCFDKPANARRIWGLPHREIQSLMLIYSVSDED